METSDQTTSDQVVTADVLSDWVRDARSRTLQLVGDLDDEQLIGPKLPTINPLLWEIGHTAWFQENWVLQHAARQKPIQRDGERLFDSIGIEHDVRWDLPLPSRDHIIEYIKQVRDAVLELLDQVPLADELIYFVKLSVFHEDMHTESFTYTRQTLAYPAPTFDVVRPEPIVPIIEVDDSADVDLVGGVFPLGALRNAAFVFDNEKWAHPVSVEPFSIACTAASQKEFAEFVDDEGYLRPELWSKEGWEWRNNAASLHPVYWKRNGNLWLCRHFDRWLPLEPSLPVIHVNWFEADAFCRWAARRLPTEAEWEFAAAAVVEPTMGRQTDKRHYPWGASPPTTDCANLDWQSMGTVSSTAHAAGDSPDGTRQLIGNVWEWTATTLHPYPEFEVDPYKEYSRPCFGNCKVLRGGCWATRARMIRNTWRNFYQPDRRDVFAGFRTCALKA